MEKPIKSIIEKLSPLERKIVPYLSLSVKELMEKTALDSVSINMALKLLENKGIVKINSSSKVIIELGVNGIYYKKNHLPERRLLSFLEERNHVSLEEAQKQSKLSEKEFKVSLGVLKSKALIELNNGKIVLTASKLEISKNFPEEKFLELIPIEQAKLSQEQLYAFNNLKKRKDIIEIKENKEVSYSLTEIGKKIISQNLDLDLIEEVTPEIIKNWNRNKKLRSYDIQAPVPRVAGGKKHFVNQAIEYAKSIWLELGFTEMNGSLATTSFWNFDALFTAQDHPVREMHDTFFLKEIEGNLPDKKIVERVKHAHENGIEKSKGWQYSWNEEEAKKVVLRTHTTSISAKTLASLNPKDIPAKFFAIGKCFRNETVDWNHSFEFYQTEGIVIDKNITLRHLLGYLSLFYKKMDFPSVRFVPAYFPYTEPSVEIHAYHPEKKKWIELGGAGIFRPEITIPLLGFEVPVLAWGQGFDRIITDYYKIADLREIYRNDIKELREKKFWIKWQM